MAEKKRTAFLSNSPNQQVVIDPGQPQLLDPQGAVVQKGRPPVFADFAGNRLETDDKDVIKRLREDDLFQHPNGWWEEGKAPDEPKPTREAQNKAITQATAKGDLEKLDEIRQEELDTHNRRDVLENIDTAVSAIEVPKAEEAGVVHRTDSPAEAGEGVPKVDAPVTPQGSAMSEVDAERMTKDEDLARARAEAVGDETIEKKLEAEVEAVSDPKAPEGEKLVDAVADAGTTSKKQTSGASKSGQRKAASPKSASEKSDGESRSTKK